MDWSKTEVDFIISDYFDMLINELSNIPYNKTQHRNRLLPLLLDRSGGAVENKHRNISAVMVKLGLPYVKGYKPRYHYQKILEASVIDYVRANEFVLKPLFKSFSDSVAFILNVPDYSQIIDEPPVADAAAEPAISYDRKPFKTNYLEREQKNAALGLQGEQLVFDYEKWRLIHAGRKKLAESVVWISKDDDGAGYDILSKNDDGSDRYIEVKTTKLSKETPIYFSKNEYEFSVKNKQCYYLYRVFNLEKNPKIFKVKGSFDEFCLKEVISYKGYF